jgi:hypothetical protein
MNTVNNIQRNIYLKRPENYCETVKIIKAKTKIYIFIYNSNFYSKKKLFNVFLIIAGK